MNILEAQNLTFTYCNSDKAVLNNVSFDIKKGDFTVICGKSGCGKSTLLRLIKSSLAPSGSMAGSLICHVDDLKIGYVFQNPESQIVMDTVFDELIFGLENIGMDSAAIKLRISEISAYFGIEDLLYKKCSSLSGGQQQLINLAATMMIEPELIILDEPLSMLDPIASVNFLSILLRLHAELGLTIIICEHTLDDILKPATNILFFDNTDNDYKLMQFENSTLFIDYVFGSNNPFFKSLSPVAKLACTAVQNGIIEKRYPLTVVDFKNNMNLNNADKLKDFLLSYHGNALPLNSESCITLKNICFRYEKGSPDILNHLNLTIEKNSFLAIIGGNGAGKSTLLSILTGFRKPYRGKIKISGKTAYLPQNPAYAFVKDNIYEDLIFLCKNNNISTETIAFTLERYPAFAELKQYFHANPLDLSGGEMQLMALFKILLLSPDVLLLDEPTKGLDGEHKSMLSDLFKCLRNSGITIIMVSHDLSFVNENATSCAMLFDGSISAFGSCHDVLSSNHFYTTPIYRLMKGLNI